MPETFAVHSFISEAVARKEGFSSAFLMALPPNLILDALSKKS